MYFGSYTAKRFKNIAPGSLVRRVSDLPGDAEHQRPSTLKAKTGEYWWSNKFLFNPYRIDTLFRN